MEKLNSPAVQEAGLVRLEYKYYTYSVAQEKAFFRELDGTKSSVAFINVTTAFLKKVYSILVA